jgi:bacterioferritin (cytochrome b1)
MKTKMNSPRHSSTFMALLLLVVAVLACGGNETEQANKLVDEGNAAVKDGKTFVTDAEAKKQKMLQTNVSELAEARTLAKEVIALYDKAEDKCKEAAKKYDEASRLKIGDKFKEYLALKVKEYNKRAEVVETAKGTPQALIDSESRTSFISRANENNEKVDKLSKEAEDLAAQGTKMEKDNPDMFKQ